MSQEKLKICLIGAGNVATHLGIALKGVAQIVQIYSHTLPNAKQLASIVSSESIATDSLESITTNADIYIVSVKDDYIKTVAQLTPNCGIWAHTSGSIPMSVFEGIKSHYGVFYPLQTFSKNKPLDVSKIPFFIEGNDENSTSQLTQLAKKISTIVEPADTERRKAMHIAAVFACNFVNYMWIEADELLAQQGLDIKFMLPLLQETLNKIETLKPASAMTGPARRGDKHIINDHLQQLTGEKRQIYELISKLIINRYHEQNQL